MKVIFVLNVVTVVHNLQNIHRTSILDLVFKVTSSANLNVGQQRDPQGTRRLTKSTGLGKSELVSDFGKALVSRLELGERL